MNASATSPAHHAFLSPPDVRSSSARILSSPLPIRELTVLCGTDVLRAISFGFSPSKNRRRIVERHGSGRFKTMSATLCCSSARSSSLSGDVRSSGGLAAAASRAFRRCSPRRSFFARFRSTTAIHARRLSLLSGGFARKATDVSCTKSSALLSSTTRLLASPFIHPMFSRSSAVEREDESRTVFTSWFSFGLSMNSRGRGF